MPPTGKTVLTGPVTRFQAKKHTGEDTSVLAYEIDGDNLFEDSETILSQGNDFNYNYLAISVEPIDKEQVDDALTGQDLIELNSTDEALQSPIWKKSMDNENNALINKQM